jgi:curved DNA-binding protein
VRIAGQGGPSPNGGTAGDLILVIHVQEHPYFKREEDNLHLTLPITVPEAYHGAKVKVPTIDGHVALKVPPHSQSGSVLRLRGKGVARKGREPGDLYVHFAVHIPTSDDPKVVGAIDAIAEFMTDDVRADIKL